VRELMNLSGLALCTVQDELRKLGAVGLLTSWSNGYQRYYKANRAHPLFADLLRIVHRSGRLPSGKTRRVTPQKFFSSQQQAATASCETSPSGSARSMETSFHAGPFDALDC
jgi:hypothetical protein